MEIIEQWKGMPNFSVWFPEVIDKVKRSILKVASKELSNYNRCNIEELNEDWTRFIFEKRGGEIESIEFGTDELHEMSAKTLVAALPRMKRFPNKTERSLLQLVFDEFKNNNQWPKSRVMAARTSDERLGNYYEMSERIGYDYIIRGDPSNKNALSKLRVRGVLLCGGSNDYLRLFVRVLQAFVERFHEKPDESTITTEDLIEKNIIREEQRFLVHEMIIMEPVLQVASTFNNKGYATYEISTDVLDYKHVQTVRECLRIMDTHGIDFKREFLQDMNIDELKNNIEESRRVGLMAYDLFISYSSLDQEKANKINETAKKAGLKTFLAPKNIKGGEIGIEKIKEAIRKSSEVVVLVSKNSLASGWVFAEWGAAWILNKHITPLLYRCDANEIPDLLKQPQHMDLDELDEYIQQVVERKNAP